MSSSSLSSSPGGSGEALRQPSPATPRRAAQKLKSPPPALRPQHLDPEAARPTRPTAQAHSSSAALSRPFPTSSPTCWGVAAARGRPVSAPRGRVTREGRVTRSARLASLPAPGAVSWRSSGVASPRGAAVRDPGNESGGLARPTAGYGRRAHAGAASASTSASASAWPAAKEKGRAGAGEGGASPVLGRLLGPAPRRRRRPVVAAAATASTSAATAVACRHHEPRSSQGAGSRQLQPGAAHARPGRQPREHPAPPRDR